MVKGGEGPRARRRAGALGYALISSEDTETGRSALVAREEVPPGGAPEKGWGALVVDLGGVDAVVEVPQPVADARTTEMGVELFREVRARALAVAGFHRRGPEGSDVAHEPGSALDAAHEELLPVGYVIQPHGFDSGSRAREPGRGALRRYRAGEGGGPARRLEAAGFETGLYDGGSRFEDLAGTSNLQGRSTPKFGSHFVHLELSEDVRSDASKRTKLVEALAWGVAGRAPL